MMFFVNISNHPTTGWGEKQLNAAKNLAENVMDIKFPDIPAGFSSQEVKEMAVELVNTLHKEGYNKDNSIIHMMGELTFVITFRSLWDGRICCSTTERKAIERKNDDGTVVKTSIFEFVQFREY